MELTAQGWSAPPRFGGEHGPLPPFVWRAQLRNSKNVIGCFDSRSVKNVLRHYVHHTHAAAAKLLDDAVMRDGLADDGSGPSAGGC